ncbi:MAG: hypothetical protein JXA33_28820, partial [Anaerolineae bacterium]|nr:hypothetical protein [Anaerolineae bacterium]
KEMDAALESYAQALGLFRAVGAKLGEANVMQSLGKTYLSGEDEARYQEGAECLQIAMDLYQQIDAKAGQANIFIFWARWLAGRGQLQEALPFAEQAYALGQQIAPGHPTIAAWGRFAADLRAALPAET